MKKSDFDFLVDLLHENAGWQFTDEQYFIIDKKMYNFVREKGYASVEELIAELKMGQEAVLWQVVVHQLLKVCRRSILKPPVKSMLRFAYL